MPSTPARTYSKKSSRPSKSVTVASTSDGPFNSDDEARDADEGAEDVDETERVDEAEAEDIDEIEHVEEVGDAEEVDDAEEAGDVEDMLSPSKAAPVRPPLRQGSPSRRSARTRGRGLDLEKDEEEDEDEDLSSESAMRSPSPELSEMDRATLTPHHNKGKQRAVSERSESDGEGEGDDEAEQSIARRTRKRLRGESIEDAEAIDSPSKRAGKARATKAAAVRATDSPVPLIELEVPLPAAAQSTPPRRAAAAATSTRDEPVSLRPRPSQASTSAVPTAAIKTPSKSVQTARSVASSSAAMSPSARAAAAATQAAEASSSTSLLKPTSSDAYFASHASNKARRLRDTTSRNLISSKFGPLQASSLASLASVPERRLLCFKKEHYEPLHGRWAGYSSIAPLMFHGLGDMKAALEHFVRRMAQLGEGDAAVVQGERISRIEELLAMCEQAIGLPSKGGTPEARVSSIIQSVQKRTYEEGLLFILIHDVGAAVLLSPRNQALLKRLSLAKNINLMGSISHVRAANLANTASGIGPAWIWEPLNTLVPRDDILSARAAKLAGLPRALHLGLAQTRSAAPGSRNAGSASNGAAGSSDAHGLAGLDAAMQNLTAQSALHIFKSATGKARMLFQKLALHQLDQVHMQEEARGMSYKQVFDIASRNFIANSNDALKLVLSEFTSHGLLRRAERPASSNAAGSSAGESQATQSIGANAQSQGLGSFGADVWVRLALSDEELKKAEELCRMEGSSGG